MATNEQTQIQNDITLDDIYKAFGKQKNYLCNPKANQSFDEHRKIYFRPTHRVLASKNL